MFGVIIPTHDSERPLVPTLAALVPGATAGLVQEVIVADGQSRDETERVADYAGCIFSSSDKPLGGRLKAGAAMARGEWLMFLAPGAVPGLGWIDDTAAFARQNPGGAAVFSAQTQGFAAWMRRLVAIWPDAEQGLIIPKLLYGEIGGHRADVADPERDLLRRIGHARLAVLRTPAMQSNS